MPTARILPRKRIKPRKLKVNLKAAREFGFNPGSVKRPARRKPKA